jgi:hypothetical protein
VQRIKARREAANLPRFTNSSSSSSDAFPGTSSANLLDATLGPTSSKAGKDAESAAAAGVCSSKDAADGAADAGGSSSSQAEQQQQQQQQQQHGVLEHHLPPKMADGLPMDEDTETDNLLEFKETAAEVRATFLIAA